MQNLNKLSEEEAQKSFIHRIRKLETFGQSFFSVTVSDCDVNMVYVCIIMFLHCICGVCGCMCLVCGSMYRYGNDSLPE